MDVGRKSLECIFSIYTHQHTTSWWYPGVSSPYTVRINITIFLVNQNFYLPLANVGHPHPYHFACARALSGSGYAFDGFAVYRNEYCSQMICRKFLQNGHKKSPCFRMNPSTRGLFIIYKTKILQAKCFFSVNRPWYNIDFFFIYVVLYFLSLKI